MSDSAQARRSLGEAFKRRRPIEVSWRKAGGKTGSGRRILHLRSRTLVGRVVLKHLASRLVDEAWGGEIRLRYGTAVLHTGIAEITSWPEAKSTPAVRMTSVWRQEERVRATSLAFIGGLRTLVENAGRRRIIHPRDAAAIIFFATDACKGPVSVPVSARAQDAGSVR